MKNYITGFIICIALTLTAFFLVMQQLLNGQVLVLAIIGLALIQFWVQLIFFLHLDREKNPKWNLAVFLTTLSIVAVIVAGSLWIMGNLSYRHTSTQDIFQNEAIPK